MTNKNLNLGTYKFDTSQLDWYRPDYGKLDQTHQGILDSYGETKNAYNQGYQTDIQALDNSWKNFLERDKQSRLENKQAFSAGQQTIAEDSFDRLRGTQNDLSARGLGASGLAQAGVVQDRIEKGRSINSLANQFVNQGTQLNLQAQEAQDNYGTTRQKYADSLRTALAELLTKENTTKMDYTKMITDLEKSVADSRNNVLNSRGEWDRLFQTDTNQNTTTQANWENTLNQQDIAKQQWEQTFNENVRQYNEKMRLEREQMAQQRALAQQRKAQEEADSKKITADKKIVASDQDLTSAILMMRNSGANNATITDYIKKNYKVDKNFNATNYVTSKGNNILRSNDSHKINIY